MNKHRNLLLAVTIILLAAPAFLSFAKAPRNEKAAVMRNLSIFNSVYKEMVMSYVDTVDSEKAINTAIGSMLSELDPYTEYIPEKAQEDFMMISTGEYGGIGSMIMQTPKNGVLIAEPYENTPASNAGLRPGDRIIKINNDTTLDWTSAKISEHLKGQVNVDLTLTVDRPYVEDSILTFKITRKKIQLPSVPFYKAYDNGMGYIKLTTFNENSPEEIKKALMDLKNDKRVSYIVLDLRGNGGGVLESAITIANYFLPKNIEVLRTKGRVKQNERIYKTQNKPIDTKIPLAVLIDNGSASASEVVAGIMQDLDRAVIIGNRSFGKGLVQSTRPLVYNNLLKVTVAKYYIPSGRLIQAIDYSHRNPDGSVARILDSLTTVFKTRNGREVRDGGGITPDVEFKYPKMTRLVYNILRDNWDFNYATKFRAEHDSIPSANDFVITDSIFNDFKRFIDPKKFNYDKVCETAVKDLKELAKLEGYMNDSTEMVLGQLEKLLHHDLSHDLDIHREEIETMLYSEILKRYYFQKGVYENSINHDKMMDTVADVFKNRKYLDILNPKKEEK